MYTFGSRVRYSETDENGVLSLTGIMNYFQDCSTFQSEDLGLGITYLDNIHRAWWLASWQIVVHRSPVLGEFIRVGTWPYAFRSIYGYRNFVLQDEAGQNLVCANSVWLFFDTERQTPVRVKKEDIEGYGTGNESRLAMNYAEKKICLPKDMRSIEPFTVGPHQIDTNHHVNNVQYVEMARALIVNNSPVRELRVEYKRAAGLGDVVYPYLGEDEEWFVAALCDAQRQPYANICISYQA